MERQNLSQTKKAIAPSQSQTHTIARSSTHPIEELQGAIGNQAVNKLLANQPIVQAKPMFKGLSGELRSPTPLQAKPAKEADRASVSEVQPENKTGLPDRLKAGIENYSGLAMDDVRVHYNSSKPSDLQALAYTQGTDIHVAPGQETHLPHEAWHVVQQKQGRVKPTIPVKGVGINDDNELESEAEMMGAKSFLKGAIANRVVQKLPVNIGGKGQIQRKIYHRFNIGGKDDAVWEGSAEEFYNVLSRWLESQTDEETKKLQVKWPSEGKRKKKIVETIKEMMAKGRKRAVVKEGLHLSTALRRQKHVFDDQENAIRKILAEEYREESTKKEEKLATEVMSNSVIVQHLQSVASKIINWDFYKSYKDQVKGEYGFYMRSKSALYKKVRVDDILSTSNDLTKLISAIHDVTSFLYNFGTKGNKNKEKLQQLDKDIKQLENNYSDLKPDLRDKELGKKLLMQQASKKIELNHLKEKQKEANEAVNTPDDKSSSTYDYNKSVDPKNWKIEHINQVRPELFESIFGKKAKVKAYIEEKSKVMKKVRENEMLVEIGPSYTTGRLMQLCQTLGCSDEEKISVALAIFAFWNKDYLKSISGIHRFHFVMDMCKNYVPGLNYDISYPEGGIGELADFLKK
jgi:Domain of unknown function (DUF4157)